MARAKIIVNPYAGRWKGRRSVPAVEVALKEAGVDFDLVCTAGPHHAIELAREAALEGYRPVVAAGGDGTIGEVVNGLVQAAGDQVAGPMAIIPLGSANDFIQTLGTPADLKGACQLLRTGQVRTIDVGRVNERCFINDVGVGFEPQVTLESRKIKRLRGKLIYLVAVLRAVRDPVQAHMTIEWDGGRQVSKPILMVSVANGRCTGGFWLTPYAELDDGELDFIFADALSRLQILRFLPEVMRGTHLDKDPVTYGRTRHIVIASDDPLPVVVDGEIMTTEAHRLEIEVMPGRMQVLC
ncbi:MAG: diacylglycerol kinase family lipid kinase [Anaerolineales bacterium]|nr:MAG: diacylglycerol kinase family lipid kinase [Anaerolineales bacterium]